LPWVNETNEALILVEGPFDFIGWIFATLTPTNTFQSSCHGDFAMEFHMYGIWNILNFKSLALGEILFASMKIHMNGVLKLKWCMGFCIGDLANVGPS
jgi:hypothetical protein